jgi:hypothetical protein
MSLAFLLRLDRPDRSLGQGRQPERYVGRHETWLLAPERMRCVQVKVPRRMLEKEMSRGIAKR